VPVWQSIGSCRDSARRRLLGKEHLAKYLDKHGYDIKDYGNGTDQDYPDVAANVAEAVSNGEHDRALLVCAPPRRSRRWTRSTISFAASARSRRDRRRGISLTAKKL
jgi:hypothetical protein